MALGESKGIATRVARKLRRASNRLMLVPKRLRLRTFGYRYGAFQGKIFCIGRNKTGTTSLEYIFQRLGYRVANQARSEQLIFDAKMVPDKRFWRWVDAHQVFQDSPFNTPWLLPELVSHYPDARFLLSIRDEGEWLASLINHHREHLGLSGAETPEDVRRAMQEEAYIGKGYWFDAFVKNHPHALEGDPYDRAALVADYRKYHQLVRTLVPQDRLLELDLSQEADTRKLGAFLGLPASFTIEIPRLNQRRGA